MTAGKPPTDAECEETLKLLAEHGNATSAANAVGISPRAMRDRIATARQRKSGMIVTGRSTLTDLRTGEPVMEWVKESLDRQKAAEAQQAAFRALSDTLPRLSPTNAPSVKTEEALCTVYTLTDCHVGALAWHREGGADWDLEIAEETLLGCFNHMIDTSPKSELGVVNQLGDFLHFDGLEAATPTSHNLLDADGRFEKVVQVAIRVLRRVVDRALEKHSRVHVILAEGNHDLASSVWLRQMFAALYEKEPRITVEQSPLPYYAVEWGNTLGCEGCLRGSWRLAFATLGYGGHVSQELRGGVAHECCSRDVEGGMSDDTKHLLSSPGNAQRLRKAIEEMEGSNSPDTLRMAETVEQGSVRSKGSGKKLQMKPLVIPSGRSTLLFSDNWLEIQIDGKCFSGVFLSQEQKIALSKALWYSVPEGARKG